MPVAVCRQINSIVCRPDARHKLTQMRFTACEEIMTALEDCHARGFLWKSMGMCNDAKHQVNLCLRAERVKRTAANREAAKIKREKIKKAWAEIEENS
jgi:COX assembly protein 2